MKMIRESGVDFDPYEENRLFHIEQSTLYASFGEGIKTTEFILQKNANIIFVEAKTNVPNPENKDLSAKNRENYETFFSEVPAKFVDSFGIYTAALLRKYSNVSEIGTDLQEPDLSAKKLIFALVITNPTAQIDWLPPIHAVLEDRLRRWMKIWDIDVVVCNQALAKQYGLIANSEPLSAIMDTFYSCNFILQFGTVSFFIH